MILIDLLCLDIFKYGEGKKHMGRRNDEIAWALVFCDLKNLKRWTCPYCNISSSGSVTRVKHHLAKNNNAGISPCPRVPREV